MNIALRIVMLSTRARVIIKDSSGSSAEIGIPDGVLEFFRVFLLPTAVFDPDG